jgi:hypothetical protein
VGIQYFPEGKALVPYPTAWAQTAFGPVEIIVSIVEPAQGSGDPYQDRFIVGYVAVGALPTTHTLSNIVEISSRGLTIDGLPAEETVYDADADGVNVGLRFREIAIPVNGAKFGVVYISERDDFDRNNSTFDDMINNIRLGSVIMSGFDLNSDLESPGKSPLASDGNTFLAVSCREIRGIPEVADLIGQIVGPDRLPVGDEILIDSDIDVGNTGCRFVRPEVTFDGANYLVTYIAPVSGDRGVVAKRVSPSGILLDNDPIDIAGDSNSSQFEPSAVYTGSHHMIVWHRRIDSMNDQIAGALVAPDGTVTGRFTVIDDLRALFPDQMIGFLSRTDMAIASNRIMVTVEPRFAFDIRQPERPIYAQILDLNGARQLGSPMLVRHDNGDNPRYAQVASDSQSFLVAWVEGLLDTSTISSGDFGLYARQVSTAGQIINGDATSVGLTIEPLSSLPIEELAVEFINDQYEFLWSSTAHRTNHGIYRNTLSSDLSISTTATKVAAVYNDAQYTSMPRATSPSLASSADTTLYIWSSRDGTLDAWPP